VIAESAPWAGTRPTSTHFAGIRSAQSGAPQVFFSTCIGRAGRSAPWGSASRCGGVSRRLHRGGPRVRRSSRSCPTLQEYVSELLKWRTKQEAFRTMKGALTELNRGRALLYYTRARQKSQSFQSGEPEGGLSRARKQAVFGRFSAPPRSTAPLIYATPASSPSPAAALRQPC